MKHITHFNRQITITAPDAAVTLNHSVMEKLIPLLVITLVLLANTLTAQYKITEIVTDYNGYWKSSSAAVNAVKPDNSHNLLSFSYSGVRYSTGANDAALTAHGDHFIAGDYRALPVTSITGSITSNTKIGLGEKYDGVTNGKSTPSPSGNLQSYLTDGIKGLNIGTCVANLPSSSLSFAVSNVKLSAINDNIPDVVITQTGDPSPTNFDRYQFTDINGNRVGNAVDIVLSNIPSVGTWVADFYDPNASPMTLAPGFTKTERGLRLWTADFGVFGINASNISQVAYFKITLNGDSDVAFVAYNNNALDVNLILPTTLTSFTGKTTTDGIALNWQTASESNSNHFVVERSIDGSSFTPIGTVKAAGNSNSRLNYNFKAPLYSGRSLYRLRMVDMDGKTSYSNIISINTADVVNTTLAAYPNPAKTFTSIKHPAAGPNSSIGLYNANGVLIRQLKATDTETRLDLSSAGKGTYHVLYSGDGLKMATSIIVQ